MSEHGTAQERVERGLAWLDENAASNSLDVEAVDLNELDIWSGMECLLAQAGGSGYIGVLARLNKEPGWAVQHGFLAARLSYAEADERALDPYTEQRADADALTVEWVRVLRERRDSAAVAQ